MTLALCIATPLGLAGCTSDEPPETFPPVDYSYLSQIHLNVASISIQDNASPTPGSLEAKAPTPPDAALRQMANQRLIPNGQSGHGDFIINQATISPAGNNALSGTLDVQLNLTDADSHHTGFVQAHVTRQMDAGAHDASSQTALHDLTTQMMQDMNVELEFQVHKKLLNWMTDAIGNPIGNQGVQQQTLGAPGTEPSSAPSPQPSPQSGPVANTPAATDLPDAIFPTGSDRSQTDAPKQKTPPTGVLTLPSQAPKNSSGY